MNEFVPEKFRGIDQPSMSREAGHIDVEPNRRLITSEIARIALVEEYIDPTLKERLIALRNTPDSVDIHHRLTRRGIPVFPVIRADQDHVLLHVPADARTVLSGLRFIARDVVGYGPTFRQIGDLMARAQASGFGLPSTLPNRGVLDGLAIASDDNSRYGSGLTLIPPYMFDPEITKSATLDQIEREMAQSGHFSHAKVDFLLRQVAEGWHEFRH